MSRQGVSTCVTSAFVVMLLTSQFPLPVYGHGLSNDEAPPQSVGDRNITVAVRMIPAFLLGDISDYTIQIRLKDTKTDATIPHATFFVTIDKQGRTLISDQFHAHDGELFLTVKPTNNDSPTVSANKESLGWIGGKDSRAVVEAPIFLDGGLYHYKIEVLTIDNDSNRREPPLVFDAYVSVGEEAKHSITVNDVPHDFLTRTYFDKIENFRFDDNSNVIHYSMPFNWNKEFMGQIPLLHTEVLIPKSVSELMISSYRGTLNGVELPRNAIILDDSNPDMRIVHYMLPGDTLIRIADQGKISPDTSDAQFTLEALDVPIFPLITLTNGEKFRIELSWNPANIEPGKPVKFIFSIIDPRTGDTVTNVHYEFALIKDGKVIYSNSRTAVIGAEVEQYTFSEEHAGNIVVRFANINHTEEFTDYLITVIPEFSTGVLMVLMASLLGFATFALRKYKALSVLR